MKWEVRTPSGALVTSLDVFARTIGATHVAAAKALLEDDDLANAAPARLRDEAKATVGDVETKAKPKPGGGTPPPIANRSFVSWSGGKGQVDLIVTNGKVPGVDGDVTGSAKSPAARVVVWENEKATRKKIGAMVNTLKRIAPIGGKPGKKSGPEALVSVLADHETKCADLDLPAYAAVTGSAVKAVYDRGVQAWPGEDVTSLTAEEWGVGRVEHFVKAAAGETAQTHDADLLDTTHPLHKPLRKADPPLENAKPVEAPAGTETVTPAAVEPDGKAASGFVTVDLADLDNEVKSLLEGIDPE